VSILPCTNGCLLIRVSARRLVWRGLAIWCALLKGNLILRAETVDRVIVSTSSVASVVPGLRDYSVELDVGGTWTTVGSVSNEFFSRTRELRFRPVSRVIAIEVVVTALDYNSEVGGLPPLLVDAELPQLRRHLLR